MTPYERYRAAMDALLALGFPDPDEPELLDAIKAALAEVERAQRAWVYETNQEYEVMR